MRGVYFTSALQEGVPFNTLLREKFLPTISQKVKSEIDRLGNSRETYNSDERLLGDIRRWQELDAFHDTMSLGKVAMVWMQKN